MKLFHKDIDDVELVFFDVETTGLYPSSGDAVCELGAVKIQGGTETAVFNELINPKRSIPPEASAVHHIYDSDVDGKPYFEEVVDRFLYFIGSSVLCGYNIGFDLGFLNAELTRIKYPPIDIPSIDVLVMARRTIQSAHYNLKAVTEHLNISAKNFHRALDDAIATKDIFLIIKDIAAQKGIRRTGDFISLYGFDNNFFKKHQEPKIAFLKESIRAQLKIQIRYVSYANTANTFIIIPKKVEEKEGRKYLIAVHSLTQKELTFNLSRILRADIV